MGRETAAMTHERNLPEGGEAAASPAAERDEADRRRRAAARRSWPIAVYRLGEEPGDDLSATTTAEERLAMVWELTQEAWRLAGREMPAYERSEAPIRIVRPFLGRTDDEEGR